MIVGRAIVRQIRDSASVVVGSIKVGEPVTSSAEEIKHLLQKLN